MQDEEGLIKGINVKDIGGYHEDQANSLAGALIKMYAKSNPARKAIYESRKRKNTIQ